MKKEKFKVKAGKKIVTDTAYNTLPLIGWRFVWGHDHDKWFCPCGECTPVIIARTPSDHRTHYKNVSRLRRCKKTRHLIIKE